MKDVLNLGASLPPESRAGLNIVLLFHNQSAKHSQESQGHFMVKTSIATLLCWKTYTDILQKFVPSGDFLDPTHSHVYDYNYCPLTSGFLHVFENFENKSDPSLGLVEP